MQRDASDAGTVSYGRYLVALSLAAISALVVQYTFSTLLARVWKPAAPNSQDSHGTARLTVEKKPNPNVF